MRPIYFAPNLGGISADKVRDLGLGYLVDGRNGITAVPMLRGPGGSPAGVVFAPAPVTNIAHLADGAKWEPYPGLEDEGIYFAFDPKSPPKPEELARAEQLSGHSVRLADGREWLIPVARFVNGATPLPKRLTLGPDGWKTGDVVELYRELWDGGCQVWEKIIEASGKDAELGEPIKFTLHTSANIAALALSANYRVSAVEVSAFGLLTTATQQDIVLSLVDWPNVKKIQEVVGAPN